MPGNPTQCLVGPLRAYLQQTENKEHCGHLFLKFTHAQDPFNREHNFWFVKAIERFDSSPKSRAHDVCKVAFSTVYAHGCSLLEINHPERIFLSSRDIMQMSLSVLFHVLLVWTVIEPSS